MLQQLARLLVVVTLLITISPAFEARAQEPDLPGEIHPTVLKLLDRSARDAAFTELITWQKNLFRAGLYSPADREVVDVVVYPQLDEAPLYAVFSNRSRQKGRVTLFDRTGSVVPFYQRSKIISERFEDVDGDGRVEIIGKMPIRVPIEDDVVYMEALFVLPITRENRAVLTVLHNAKLASLGAGPLWTWRLYSDKSRGLFGIEIGPQEPGAGSIQTNEDNPRYVWSRDRGGFDGPAGGLDQPFLRVDGLEDDEIVGYAQQVAKVRRPIHVGGDVVKPVAIHTPQPVYTEEARERRIQGVVILQAVIDVEGNVIRVKVLKGLPYGLSEAAASAIRRWKFEPARLHGEPVAVYYNLTSNFRLE